MQHPVVLALAAALVLAGSAAGQPRYAAPPPGDYWGSCRNLTAGPGSVLSGECRDEQGRWRPSSVQFAGCERIDIRDGQMLCRGGFDRDRERDRDRPPGYGYGSQLTLYAAPDFAG